MKHISSSQAIETLEHVHELLDQKNDLEMRRTLQEIIHVFRKEENIRLHLRQTSKANLTYIPPGL